MNATQERWRMRFSGRVQHVGFRYTALYLARKLDITGWVENLKDGSVLMEAQGGTAQLRKLFLQLKSQPHLRIVKTEIAILPLLPTEKGFSVRPPN